MELVFFLRLALYFHLLYWRLWAFKQSWELILLADMMSHKTSLVYLSKDVLLDQEDVLISCVFLCIWKLLKILEVSRPVTSHSGVSAKSFRLDVVHTAQVSMPHLSLDYSLTLALWKCSRYDCVFYATAEEFNSSAVAVLGVAEGLNKGNSNYAVFIPPWYHISLCSTETQKCF